MITTFYILTYTLDIVVNCTHWTNSQNHNALENSYNRIKILKESDSHLFSADVPTYQPTDSQTGNGNVKTNLRGAIVLIES